MTYQTLAIADFCNTGSGGTPSRKESSYYDGGTIPWVKSGELRENTIFETEEHITDLAVEKTSVKLVPKGAILLAMYGATVGRMATLGIEATTNQAICHIIPDEKVVNKDYLYHCLQHKVPELLTQTVGGAQPNINQRIIKQTQIPVPPMGEQRRIAAILDKADSLRAQRRAALAKLDTLLQATFLHMFGDPVTNPMGWEKVRLGDLADNLRYGTSTPPGYTEQGTPFIRATNIKNGTVVTNDLRFISKEAASKIEKCKVKKGDLVIVRSGVNSGDCALIPEQYHNAYAGYDIIFEMPFDWGVFTNHFINSPQGQHVIKPMTRRAGQPHLNAKQVKSIELLNPSLNLLKEFREIWAKLEELKQKHKKGLSQLDNLFHALQQRAFKGQL